MLTNGDMCMGRRPSELVQLVRSISNRPYAYDDTHVSTNCLHYFDGSFEGHLLFKLCEVLGLS